MFDSITAQIILFIISGALIWFYSNRLAGGGFISEEFKLGSAFGGTIVLAIITNLAEIAIIAKGTISGDTSLAVGNILGGIAIQTLLLSFFDFLRQKKIPLSTIISSHGSMLQGLFLVFILDPSSISIITENPHSAKSPPNNKARAYCLICFLSTPMMLSARLRRTKFLVCNIRKKFS